MIELIEGLPEPVVGLRANGRVTQEDYDQTVLPAVRAMLESRDRIRLLYVVGDDFDGYSLGAVWEDAKLLGSLRSWERIAVVTDAGWIEHGVKAFGWMIPGEVRVMRATWTRRPPGSRRACPPPEAPLGRAAQPPIGHPLTGRAQPVYEVGR